MLIGADDRRGCGIGVGSGQSYKIGSGGAVEEMQQQLGGIVSSSLCLTVKEQPHEVAS